MQLLVSKSSKHSSLVENRAHQLVDHGPDSSPENDFSGLN